MKQFFIKFRGPLCLFLCAFFWGTTFVAQSLGSDYVMPFTYNGSRFIITGIILTIVSFIFKPKEEEAPTKSKKWILAYSVLVGLSLFIASSLQQFGIEFTKSPAKSGFITSLYMILVPILGVFFKKKIRPIVFFCAVLALVGSYMIASVGGMHFEIGDILTLLCALFFAFQIIFIDIVAPHISSIRLSAIEFLIAGVLSIVLMFITEPFEPDMILKASLAIIYAAIFSGCIAYTLQIVGQKYTDPNVSCIIMSLESVFSLISGVIVLHERLSLAQGLGCTFVFIAVIIAQLDFSKLKRK